MLYIFHVDTGTTITFDMNLALESVAQLKEAIERECGVEAGQQVLLVSGGECLEPNARVCTYSAGTDTNPIYLFSKASIESHQPPAPSIDYGSDVDLQAQIEGSLAMPATYQTVVNRAQLGQQCCALAREQTRICERLVHDQHLQQQGWAAVVANLEDITQMFQSRADLLRQSFTHYLAERQQHIELLNSFNEDLGMLAKIPILPALRAHAEGLLSPEGEENPDLTTADNSNETLSLLKWISAKDNQSSLEQVAEQCARGLEQFDEKVMESLKAEVNSAIEAANKQDMKEIKGLGERLYGLEQLMFDTKKLVQEQGDLAQAFLQNQNRASNLGDASILPDLCASHRRQLMVMLQNHNHLRDIRRRCTKAKEELSVNLYHRLKWIMYVENKVMEVDGKLVMYHESLKRLRRHLEVLHQIHLAPEMYMSAVAEVVRRRTFSQAFLVWASNLACQLLTVHSDELARRTDFQGKFDGHFLNTLFPGLEDTPPSFATQAPSVFDSALPKLTSSDMESLRETLPDLALAVSTPDLNGITQFFLSKSLTEGSTEAVKDKEGKEIQDEVSEECQQRRALLLGTRGEFESETDTEEFEKIGQDAADMKPLPSFDAESQQQQKQSEVGSSQSVSLSSPMTNAMLDLEKSSTTNMQIDDQNVFISSLRRTSMALSMSGCSNPSLYFPHCGSVSNERPLKLSPLPECAENGNSNILLASEQGKNSLKQCSEYRSYTAPPCTNYDNPIPVNNFSLITNPLACGGGGGGGGQQSGSTGSSPSVGAGMMTDFIGTEFYMDESLPSSLSEHPADVHQQAIVSLLQESLGSSREEVARLQSVLRCMKSVASDALSAFRQEFASIKEQTVTEQCGFTEFTNSMQRALKLHSRECERMLREKEQALTVDHELELGDLKKLVQGREEEIRSLKQTILEKDSERLEHERLLNVLKQKMHSDQLQLSTFQSRIIMMEEALDRAHLEKEMALKETHEASHAEICCLKASLLQSQEQVKTLEENLSASRADHEEAMKAASDKFQKEYKTALDTIRSRFKFMAASTMERSPSDSSLEKIERPNMIELVNHEAIVAQMKEDMKAEQAIALRVAIEKERTECAAKLDHELRLARQRTDAERQVWFNEAMRRVIEEKERQVEAHRSRESLLGEDCERLKETIRRLTESENMVRQTLSETVESLEADKVQLEANMDADRLLLKERETQIHNLEAERDRLREELNDERLKMRQDSSIDLDLKEAMKLLEAKNESLENIKAGTDSRLQQLEAEKDKLKAELEIHRKNDDTDVSESKKVRLESDPAAPDVLRRLEFLENENKILRTDLCLLRDSKDRLDTKLETLQANKVSLEVELVKERSRRNLGPETFTISVMGGTSDDRDKDMSTSVAVCPESSSNDAGTNPGSNYRDTSVPLKDKLSRSTANLIQQARISISSCNPGDVNLVLWDPQHRNYILLQESPTLYFLHSDCVDTLDLRLNSDGTPRKLFTAAEVIDKEYCHAKKPENRYRVPQGTKFYRVKVRRAQKDPQMSTSSKGGSHTAPH